MSRKHFRSRAVGPVLVMLGVVSQALATPVAAFDRLKALEGKWEIRSEGKALPIQMSYEAGSKGSILTERFGKELSVFFLDRQELQMIHFCNAGNQPRLRLAGSSRADVLEFEMFDITGLKSPDADHVQRIIYTLLSDRRMDLEIVWRKGNSQESEKYNLERI